MLTEKKINIKNILIVDDEIEIRLYFKKILEQQGYCTYMVENPLKLMPILKLIKISLILLDINLPWIDGREICKAIKKNNAFNKIKIICVSGVFLNKKICLESGCDAYLKKPFEKFELVKIVNSVFK